MCPFCLFIMLWNNFIWSYLPTAILTALLFALYMNEFFMACCVSLIAIPSVLRKHSTSFHISFHCMNKWIEADIQDNISSNITTLPQEVGLLPSQVRCWVSALVNPPWLSWKRLKTNTPLKTSHHKGIETGFPHQADIHSAAKVGWYSWSAACRWVYVACLLQQERQEVTPGRLTKLRQKYPFLFLSARQPWCSLPSS